MRRGLSGIYIFEKLEGDKKRKPTCFEDCTIDTKREWLDSLDTEGLKGLALMLATTITKLGDAFDIKTTE